MHYLQLAEGGGYAPPQYAYELSQGQYDLAQESGAYMLSQSDPLRNYLFVPDGGGGGNWVNVEMFAYMPAAEFEALLEQLEPFQPNIDEPGMALFGSRKKNAAWRNEKRQARMEKKKARTDVIRARAEKKRGTAAVRGAKAEGIRTGSWRGGGAGQVISDVVGNVAGVAGKIFGGGGNQAGQAGLVVDGGFDFSNQPPPPSFMQQYGPILAVVVIGGVVLYFATRKK